MKKPVSGILSNLIVLAEEIVTRPSIVLTSPRTQERVALLSVDVREADAQMYEGEPTTSSGVVMIMALEQYLIHEGKGLAPMWLALAGAALPLLREEAFKALTNEREARRS